MAKLNEMAAAVGARLKEQDQTVAVFESSTGGLVSAALLAVPGASAYYQGGGVIYTAVARAALTGIPKEAMRGVRSSSEPYALMLARAARETFGTDWGVGETGAAGPTGNRYGDAAGHTCIAIAGPVEHVITLETGDDDRERNMWAFAEAVLDLLGKGVGATGR
ncbi:MAG: CinA family protein [Alphaproteobacteria bacterium]